MRQAESSRDTVQRRKNSCLRDAFVFFLWHTKVAFSAHTQWNIVQRWQSMTIDCQNANSKSNTPHRSRSKWNSAAIRKALDRNTRARAQFSLPVERDDWMVVVQRWWWKPPGKSSQWSLPVSRSKAFFSPVSWNMTSLWRSTPSARCPPLTSRGTTTWSVTSQRPANSRRRWSCRLVGTGASTWQRW